MVELAEGQRGRSVKDIMVLGKNLESIRMTPVRLLPIVKRVPKLAFSCNQISNYPNCNHKTFME